MVSQRSLRWKSHVKKLVERRRGRVNLTKLRELCLPFCTKVLAESRSEPYLVAGFVASMPPSEVAAVIMIER